MATEWSKADDTMWKSVKNYPCSDVPVISPYRRGYMYMWLHVGYIHPGTVTFDETVHVTVLVGTGPSVPSKILPRRNFARKND